MGLPIYTQGRLDGLCGVYAFVNGYIHRLVQTQALVDGSLGGDFSADLFELALQSIPRNKFPNIIWQGMSKATLIQCCKRTCRRLDTQLDRRHEVIAPFGAGQFRKIETFFDALVPFHCDRPASMVILGLEGDADHWVAFRSFHTGKIKLLNNGGRNSFLESELSLRQGARNFIRQEETIVIRLLRE